MRLSTLAMLAAPFVAAQPPAIPSPVTAPCSNLACDVQVDWLRNMGMVQATATAMPEDKYGFKPTEPQQNFGERVLHVAEVNMMLLGALGGRTPAPTVNLKATSKAEILEVLRKVTDYGTAVLKELSEKQLVERIPSPEVMKWFMGPEQSRLRVINFLMMHAQDTYGQLVVYLRLSGIVPPLSRTP